MGRSARVASTCRTSHTTSGWPKSHRRRSVLRRDRFWARDDQVIDVEDLRGGPARDAAVECELDGIQSELSARSKLDSRPTPAQHPVNPKLLRGVLASGLVELDPELDMVPSASTQRERLDVLLGAIAEAAPARDAVRFPGHGRIIRIETCGARVTGDFSDHHGRKEIAPVRAEAGLPHRGPLVVGARSIERDELGTASPLRWKPHVQTHIQRVVAGQEEVCEPAAVAARLIRDTEKAAA